MPFSLPGKYLTYLKTSLICAGDSQYLWRSTIWCPRFAHIWKFLSYNISYNIWKFGFLKNHCICTVTPTKLAELSWAIIEGHWTVNWANILNFLLLRTTWLYRCLSKKLVQEENPRPKTWLIKITTSSGIFLSEEPGSSHSFCSKTNLFSFVKLNVIDYLQIKIIIHDSQTT